MPDSIRIQLTVIAIRQLFSIEIILSNMCLGLLYVYIFNLYATFGTCWKVKEYIFHCKYMMIFNSLWGFQGMIYFWSPSFFYNTLMPRENGNHFAEDIFKCNSWLKIFVFWLNFAKPRFECDRETNCIIMFFTIFNCMYFVFWRKVIALQKKHITLYIVRIVVTAFCWPISSVCKCLIKFDFNFSTLGTVKWQHLANDATQWPNYCKQCFEYILKKKFWISFKFHWSWFSGVRLTITHHWPR